MKHNALIVLKSLLDGNEIEMSLSDDHEEIFMWYEGRFGIRRQQITIKDGKEIDEKDVFLPLDMTLSTFVNMCEKMSQDKIFTILGTDSLNAWKKSQRKQRDIR